VFVAAAVVLAVVPRRRRGDDRRGRRSDAAGAGNGSEPIVEPPTYDPDRPTDAGTATILRDGSDDTDADPRYDDDLSPRRSTPRVRAIRSNSRASSSPRRRSSSTSRG